MSQGNLLQSSGSADLFTRQIEEDNMFLTDGSNLPDCIFMFQGAETRLEDQISKLVVEKQELEWQKESLQHQIEMLTNQHTESLTGVKKQGKHQLSAELKDKEINSLKEELKSLQVILCEIHQHLFQNRGKQIFPVPSECELLLEMFIPVSIPDKGLFSGQLSV
uniref:Uncharacterized protein n=1 Tax=Myripristis murdjan TaxID=586833 RepID=A0A667YR26_9TELE